MSKGLGSVQRKINQLFAGDSEGVFTTEDLCREIYGGEPSKKQRVAVLRAAKAVAKQHRDIACWKSETRGGTCIFFHHDNVMSYAIARQRGFWLNCCDSNTEARRQLKDESHCELMKPGGTWWLFVQQWIAERDNDTARLAELQPLLDAHEQQMTAMTESLRTIFAKQA
jgi:hypothetical protein